MLSDKGEAYLNSLALLRYKLAAIKMVTPSKEHLEEHYKDLSDKPFFKGLVTCTFRIAITLEQAIGSLDETGENTNWIQTC